MLLFLLTLDSESLEKILVMKFVMLFSLLLTLDYIDEVCYAFFFSFFFFLIDLRLYLREAFGE
jgi:hypothetical protein